MTSTGQPLGIVVAETLEAGESVACERTKRCCSGDGVVVFFLLFFYSFLMSDVFDDVFV